MFFHKLYQIYENLCYWLDFFKTPFTFSISKEHKLISSKVGTLITIFIIAYLVSVFFNSNMMQKSNPSVMTQTYIENTRPKQIFQESNFEIAFGLFDIYMNDYFMDPTLFEVKINEIFRYFDENNTKHESNKSIDYHKCKQEDFPLSNTKMFYKNILCFDSINFTLEGFMNEPIVSYLNIEFFPCNNVTMNYTCQSKDNISEQLISKGFGLYYSEYVIDFTNYQNPINISHQSEYIWLDERNSKEINIFMKKDEFIDDSSMIVKNPKKSITYSKDSIISDFSVGGDLSPAVSLARIRLFSGQTIYRSIRTYQKLQEIFSTIGGSASFLISIFMVFVGFFNNWMMKKSILQNLYEMKEDGVSDKNETGDKNNANTIKKTQKINDNNKKEDDGKCIKCEMSPSKIESKYLKNDSFELEKYSKDDNFVAKTKINNNKKNTFNQRNLNINLKTHIFYTLKRLFRIPLNENEEDYKKLEEWFDFIISGNFIYQKLQEFDCLKMIILDEKQLFLFHMIEKPKFQEEFLKRLKMNMDYNEGFLYPFHKIDEKMMSLRKEDMKTFIKDLSSKNVHMNNIDKIMIEFSKYK